MAKKPKAKTKRALVTRRQLAVVLGVHMQTITKWEREGLPIASRGGKGRPSKYHEVDVRSWLQLREEAAKQPQALDLIVERARKERAQAVLAEQAYQIRTRDLLPRDEVEKTWLAEVSAVRTLLLAWPMTLSDRLHRAAITDGVAGVEHCLQHAVREVLLELADPARAPMAVAS